MKFKFLLRIILTLFIHTKISQCLGIDELYLSQFIESDFPLTFSSDLNRAQSRNQHWSKSDDLGPTCLDRFLAKCLNGYLLESSQESSISSSEDFPLGHDNQIYPMNQPRMSFARRDDTRLTERPRSYFLDDLPTNSDIESNSPSTDEILCSGSSGRSFGQCDMAGSSPSGHIDNHGKDEWKTDSKVLKRMNLYRTNQFKPNYVINDQSETLFENKYIRVDMSKNTRLLSLALNFEEIPKVQHRWSYRCYTFFCDYDSAEDDPYFDPRVLDVRVLINYESKWRLWRQDEVEFPRHSSSDLLTHTVIMRSFPAGPLIDYQIRFIAVQLRINSYKFLSVKLKLY